MSWFAIISYFHCVMMYCIINVIASIIIFITFFILSFFSYCCWIFVVVVVVVLFFVFLLFLSFYLIKQLLFSHEWVKPNRLFCLVGCGCLFVCFWFLSWNCRVIIHNLIAFLHFPKGLQFSSFISILTYFYISFWVLLFLLPLVLSFIYSNRFYGNYQWAVCLRSTLAGFFLGKVHWQWTWILLRPNTKVFGDILHSLMFSFLFLCNILT